MRGIDVVDIDLDPKEVRRGFWRRVLRYGVSLACIVLVAAGLISSTLYTSAMNRSDVLALSHDFIDAISARTHTEVRAYLAPAQNAVGSLVAALPEEPFSPAGHAVFDRVAQNILQHNPQLASIYLGTPAGEFLMVKRNDEGGRDTKLTRQTPEGRTTNWIRRDAKGVVVGTEYDNNDPYDPRTRGWFRNATRTPGLSWSKVYIFFTDKTPGITASMAVRNATHPPYAVVGADIYLNSLSAFLAKLQKQARGTLAIVNDDGEVVAFGDPSRMLVETDSGLRPKTLRELGLATLDEAFNRMRVEGPDRSIVKIDGERYVFGASSLRGAVSRDWWLMLLAPESAYLGFIAVNSRRGLLASSGIIVLSILLAAFLTYQGVVAERHARAANAGRERLDAQRRILDELAGLGALSDPNDEDDLKEASELLSEAEGARRISFWRLAKNGGELLCLDAFDEETRGHTSGTRIHAIDCGEILPLFRGGKPFEIAVAEADPRSARLHGTYLRAVGTTSLASVPIATARKALGAVWIEDARTSDVTAGDRSLARSVANLLAPRLIRMLEQEERAPPSNQPSSAPRAEVVEKPSLQATDHFPSVGNLRSASLIERRRTLISESGNGQSAQATLFPGATVLALKLLDDRTLAATPPGSSESLVIREIVERFENEANSCGIPYVKILTDLVLAVDGFGDDTSEAAGRLMDVALGVRECCNSVFLAAGQEPQFSIGIDSGAIYGSPVGFDESPYNIWGEPVRVACRLAESADPGTIQVSETTYELVHEVGIFRRRGAFFLDQIGEMTTYTLRGRL